MRSIPPRARGTRAKRVNTPELPIAKRQIRLWQKEALRNYQEALSAGRKQLLWEATPGAGKTAGALYACCQFRKQHRDSRVLVVVPTAHLKHQWARSAADFGLPLNPQLQAGRRLAADFHGAAVTYQQIAQNPGYFAEFSRNGFVILDEIHHAGDGLSWGEAVKVALHQAGFVLCLSGTAFRSDRNAIPFVQYDVNGESVPDFSYSYSRAIVEGVCRPIAFFAYGGDVAWSEHENVSQANFADLLDRESAGRRLRAALDPDSGWLEPMLIDADRMLREARKLNPQAGALLVAADRDHARKLAKVVTRISGTAPIVVLSDDARASNKIKAYAASDTPWLVACNMVSEGVDIPRLRIGVYTTTIRTRMYFRQFLGRIVRRTTTAASARNVEVAYCYLPADPWLRNLAAEVEDAQRHCLRKDNDDPFDRLERDEATEPREEGEPSWKPIHAVNSGVEAVIVSGSQLSLWGAGASESDATFAGPQSVEPIQMQHVVHREVQARLEERLTVAERKTQLGNEIKQLVGMLHRKLRFQHSSVHAVLNRKQNVRGQVECTVKQLEERLMMLEQMMSSGKLS